MDERECGIEEKQISVSFKCMAFFECFRHTSHYKCSVRENKLDDLFVRNKEFSKPHGHPL